MNILECNTYTHRFARDGDTFGEDKNQGEPEPAGTPRYYFIRIPLAVIVGLTVIVRDSPSLCAAAVRETHTSIQRGMSETTASACGDAHKRALRYDAHVVYLEYCAH